MIGDNSPFNLDGKCAVVTAAPKDSGKSPAHRANPARRDRHLSSALSEECRRRPIVADPFPLTRPMNRSRAIVEALASWREGPRARGPRPTSTRASRVARVRPTSRDPRATCPPAPAAPTYTRASDLFRGKVDILVSNVGFNAQADRGFHPGGVPSADGRQPRVSFGCASCSIPAGEIARRMCRSPASPRSCPCRRRRVRHDQGGDEHPPSTSRASGRRTGSRGGAWYINTPLAKQVLADPAYAKAADRRDARGTRRVRGGGCGELPCARGRRVTSPVRFSRLTGDSR